LSIHSLSMRLFFYVAISRRHVPHLDASVQMMLDRNPSEVDAESYIAAAVREAAAEALGAQPDVIGASYWMDMALLNTAGVPTVAFGPSGEGEHADVEWVDIESLERCVRTYLNAAARVCGRSLPRDGPHPND